MTRQAIKNYVKRMKEKIDEYEKTATEKIKICISLGNSKIGRVMNVSLAPIFDCPNCGKCCGICFDIRDTRYTNTLDARARNHVLFRRDRDEFFRRINEAMNRRRKNKYFRFHVGGDILDGDHFARIVETARKHQDFLVWTYTKSYGMVNEWIKNHGRDALPSNLSVMFSEWRGLPMQNPYGFPEFRVVFKTDAEKPTGFYCPGNCEYCIKNHCGCPYGETVYCNEH